MPDLTATLHAIAARVAPLRGPQDLRFFRVLHAVTWLATATGLALSAGGPNVLAPLLLAFGASTRWMVIAHHVCHGALDGIATVPSSWQSKQFARGWRRWWHWPDWIEADAWHREHNQLHHAYTNDPADPDLVQRQGAFLREGRLPMVLRWLVVLGVALTWRWLYYAPNTQALATLPHLRRDANRPLLQLAGELRLWDPRTPAGRRLWTRSWLSNLAFWFVLSLPLLAIGVQAWNTALLHLVLGGALCNLHTFVVIVPNHVGNDLAAFDDRAVGKAQWHHRQILASCNYHTGGLVNDLLHGWLNYQIEHHLWPNWTPRQYAAAAPMVRKACADLGIAYVQQSIVRRLGKMLAVLVGRAQQGATRGLGPVA